MTLAPPPHLPAQRAPDARLIGWLDAAFALYLIAWMAEALVRLPHPTLLTILAYTYFLPRCVFAARWLVPTVLRHWPLLIYPAVCTLSALWSLSPMGTLVAAAQLWVTVVMAVFLGCRFGLAGLAALVLWALGLTVAASAVNLAGVGPPSFGPDGGFQGIYTNKNALGQRGALLLLTLMLFLVAGGARWLWALLALGVVAMLVVSQSVTAILVGCAAAAFFLVLALKAGRGVLWVVGVTVVAVIAVTIWVLEIQPVTEALAVLGKNHTLTGRTLLWRLALDKVEAFPLLGMGYAAYWQAPQFADEVRVITGLYGGSVASFHNFLLEILTMLGPIGLAAILSFLGHCGWALLRLPHGPLALWAQVSFAMLVGLSLLGSSLYRPHEVTLLLVVALGVAASSERGGSGGSSASRPFES